LTSFGARTITMRTSRPSRVLMTATSASASARNASSPIERRHLDPAAHLALHLEARTSTVSSTR